MQLQCLKGVFADGLPGTLLIENGRIAAVRPHTIPQSCEIVDCGDAYILPAFIELHAHGGGGYDFIDNTEESFDAIFDAHLAHGVASLCPTLCACDFAEMLRFLDLCRGKKAQPGFLGVHLEGPFLSPDMSGAQNLSCLRDPSAADIEALASYADVIARITAAPELPGAAALAKRMRECGIKLSVGHSAVDAEQFAMARADGFDAVTHLYCSTRGRYKRDSRVLGGLIEAALADDGCYVELIGDGHHVCRESFLLTMKCKGVERVAVVSDAMRAAGSREEAQESYLGAKLPENRVIVEGGVAKLPDRSSFAGSLAIGDTMVQALVGRYGLPLESVSRVMSATPADLLGLADRGRLEVGLRADIAILDKSYQTLAVLREGEIVYKRE